MPRRKFFEDLEAAVQPGLFANVQDVRHGEEDGSVRFTVTSQSLASTPLSMIALVPGMGTP